MRPTPALAALAALAAVLLHAGCATVPERPAAEPLAVAAGRPADGLLDRPDLQALVDLQVRRNADGLVEALASPDSLVRARAAFALGSVQSAAAVPALRDLLGDPVPAVRADAAFALGQSADSTAGVALTVSLRTEATPAVLVEILEALGKTAGRADLPALLTTPLPDALEPYRALALARAGIRGVTGPTWAAWLAGHLRSPDPALRQRAAYAFTRAPAAAWRDQAGLVRAALDALGPSDPAAAHLVRALDRLDEAQDVPRLAAALDDSADWRTRVAAARALAGHEGEAARDALAEATEDENPHVAQAAAEALAQSERPTADDVALALDLLDDDDAAWQTQAAVLPLLARAGRADAVLAWADRHPDPFAQSDALAALGAADDGAALTRLFTTAGDEDPRLAAAALGALVERWETGAYPARRFFPAFERGLRRGDLATVTVAAPALADSAFWHLGAGPLLREVYAELEAPADVEPMTALIGAIGRVRDGDEVQFLVGIALDGHPVLRAAARDALNDRLVEGVDVEISGGGSVETTSVDWGYLARLGRHPRLVLETERGRVVIEMDAEAAPQTVQRVATTAAADHYDGVPFHRVVSNFVIQGGDYVRADGYGGPDVPIRSEFTRIPYATGTAGMASAGKDTEGAQYFVTHSPQPHLDGRYTAFGRVVEGQDVVDEILRGDLVRRARILPDPAVSRRP